MVAKTSDGFSIPPRLPDNLVNETLLYRITRYPTVMDPQKTGISPDIVDAAFALAFRRWATVTMFTFEKAKDDQDKVHFTIAFDTFEHGLTADEMKAMGNWFEKNQKVAVAFFDEAGPDVRPSTEFPVKIVFDALRAWTTIDSAETGSLDSNQIFLQRLVKYSQTVTYDIATVATHEIGHALGVPHSKDAHSIMQPDISDINAAYRYIMKDRPLHEVDCRTIALRYANSKPLQPPKPNPNGYAIVGSSFLVSDVVSSIMYKPIDKMCWGDRMQEPVQVVNGYAYNELLNAGGYATTSFHMLEQRFLGDRAYVIGGGIMRSKAGHTERAVIPELTADSAPALDNYVVDSSWGASPDEGLLRYVGRTNSWNAANNGDCDTIIYVVVSKPGSAIAPVIVYSAYDEVGDVKFRNPSTIHQWATELLAGTRTHIGDGRTWGDGKLDKAQGFFFLSTNLPQKS